MIVHTQLLERFALLRGGFVLLFAPAGYGKSTAARAAAAHFGRMLVCDLSAVRSPVDLLEAIVHVIASVHDEEAAPFAGRVLGLPRSRSAVDQWFTLAKEAWALATVDELFVFENAEHIANRRDCRDVLTRLFAGRNPNRTVTVCSRVPLAFAARTFALPHEILILTAQDLRFSREQIACIFSDCKLPADDLERIEHVSGGWPIVVLLLARFARERVLHSILQRLDDIAYDAVYDYLEREVLALLTSGERCDLLRCAVLGGGDEERLARLSPAGFVGRLARLARATPFLQTHRGSYAVHPLVRERLRNTAHDEALVITLECAQRALAAGDACEAAELYLSAGDEVAAARALHVSDFYLSSAVGQLNYASVLSRLSQETVFRHPELWSNSVVYARFSKSCETWAQEGLAILAQGGELPLHVRMAVVSNTAGNLTDCGQHEAALRLIDSALSTAFAIHGEEPAPFAFPIVLRGVIEARQGRNAEALRTKEAAPPEVLAVDYIRAIHILEYDVRFARVEGNVDAEREAISRSLDLAERSSNPLSTAYAYAQAFFTAWRDGQDDAAARSIDALEAALTGGIELGFRVLIEAARRPASAPSCGNEQMPYRAMAFLVSASFRDAGPHRITQAVHVCDAAQIPYLQILARVLAAERGAAPREEILDEALSIAKPLPAYEPMCCALYALRDTGTAQGPLSGYVTRLRRDVRETAVAALSLARGEFQIGLHSLPLTGKELAVVSALALSGRPLSRTELLERSRVEEDDALGSPNALRVLLHRLRSRLGSQTVEYAGGRYRLMHGLTVDVLDVEHVLWRQRSESVLTQNGSKTLREFLEACQIDVRHTAHPPTLRRLLAARADARAALAADALERGDAAQALAYANDALSDDPCDEAAAESAMRAYLAANQLAAASAVFRRLSQHLRADLDVGPPETLRDLLSGRTRQTQAE